mgnify:CR=1 FL=1
MAARFSRVRESGFVRGDQPQFGLVSFRAGQDPARSLDAEVLSTRVSWEMRTAPGSVFPQAEGRSCLATPTGLEPATSAVTGRRANQLRYGAICVRNNRERKPTRPVPKEPKRGHLGFDNPRFGRDFRWI